MVTPSVPYLHILTSRHSKMAPLAVQLQRLVIYTRKANSPRGTYVDAWRSVTMRLPYCLGNCEIIGCRCYRPYIIGPAWFSRPDDSNKIEPTLMIDLFCLLRRDFFSDAPSRSRNTSHFKDVWPRSNDLSVPTDSHCPTVHDTDRASRKASTLDPRRRERSISTVGISHLIYHYDRIPFITMFM